MKISVIYVDEFDSKEGKHCKIVYFNNEQGLQCKAFVDSKMDVKKGDILTVGIMPDFSGFARMRISK